MRLRGRRHWTFTVGVEIGTKEGTGPDAGETTWASDSTRQNLIAAVQSMDLEAVTRHNLSAKQEHFWVRLEESAMPLKPETNALAWNGKRLVITSVNHTPGSDVELIATAQN